MKQFIHLFQFDGRQLVRHQILSASVVITLLYIGLFLSVRGQYFSDRLFINILFNDPTLLGFLFIGVLVLLERDQMTLLALRSSPLNWWSYLLSKVIILSLLSLLCCLAMLWSYTTLENIDLLSFCFSAFFSTVLFAFLGIALVTNSTDTLDFMLKGALFIILLNGPFLGVFQVMPMMYLTWFPSYPFIDLLNHALGNETALSPVILYLLSGFWTGLSALVSYYVFKQKLMAL